MSDDLDGRLRQLTQEIADSAPVAHGWSTVEARAERNVVAKRGSRWMVAGAASAIVVLGVGALIALNSSDDTPAADVASTAGAGSTTSLSTTTTMAPVVVSVPYEVIVDGAPVGDTWVTGLATDADELSAMWGDLGATDPVPTIDFGQQVVVYFGPAESSSCPFLPLAGVLYSASTNRLYPDLPNEGRPDSDCTADANPHAVLVAIDRTALPPAPFDIWLSNGDPPSCCTNNVTTVSPADLDTPTSTLPPLSSTTTTTVPGSYTVTTSDGFPAGSFTVSDQDLFIAHDDGDLWLHPGILGDRPGDPVRVADLGDPRTPVTEGPGPNVIEKVAGVYDGSVLFSDCCEPVAGNLIAVPGPDAERQMWSFGAQPSLSPNGQRLAATQLDGLMVAALDGTSGSGRLLEEEGPYAQALDLTWTNDDEIAALVLVDSRYELRRYTTDAPMDLVSSEPLGSFDPSGSSTISIAGGFDGTAVLTFSDATGSRIEYRNPAATGPAATERQMPGNAQEVRVRRDGAYLWIDESTLWYQPNGQEPRALGSGFAAAWFAFAD